jgi:hypothetical protein
MMNQESIDILIRQITNLTGLEIRVTQDEHGRLSVLSFLDSEPEAEMLVSPYGTTMDGQELWKFEVDGYENIPIGTLDAKMIMGLLSS